MMSDLAVIFDMDGVIVDTNVFHKKAIGQFCKKYGFELSEEQLRKTVYGRTNKDWITSLFGTLPHEQLQQYAEEKEQLFRDLYAPHLKPVEGLETFLIELKKNNIPRAVATSAPPENVDFILGKSNLKKYFDTILDERMVTHGKPDPEIYLKTAQALGLPNKKCVVIEDSLSGVTAGRKSGSPVIGITTTHTPEELAETNFIIRDFTGLTIPILVSILEKENA